jgi:hypothetical protein
LRTPEILLIVNPMHSLQLGQLAFLLPSTLLGGLLLRPART